jgi:tRNA(Ile)-lysidine synthase
MAKYNISGQLALFLQEYGLRGQELLLGFSGGVDSTALLLALLALGQQCRAVHFQHGLRGKDAVADEQWCREFCRQREVAFQSLSLRVPEQRNAGESIEAAARRLRLEAWQELSESGRLPVLLAHHLDDCLEDLLLKLVRGSNASGLSGLREYRQMGTLRLYRPLLSWRKAELEEYVCGCGVTEWCIDASNRENCYRRNALRNIILPQLRQTFAGDSGLQQALLALRQDAEYLEERAAAALQDISSLESWQRLHPALLPRVLRLWLEREFGQSGAPSGKLVRRLQEALRNFQGKSVRLPLPGGEEIILERAGLQRWRPQPGIAERTWDWQNQPRLDLPECQAGLVVCTPDAIPPGAQAELFDRNALPALLRVRSWQAGDSMQPFGADFRRKLQDIFSDARVPRSRRSAMPVVLAGEEIIWLTGLRRAEFARVQPGGAIVAISYQPW